MFSCQECGRKFKTTKAAERASRNGCPKCGGVDIDLAPPTDEQIERAYDKVYACLPEIEAAVPEARN